jgi:molecular chaperone GrpE
VAKAGKRDRPAAEAALPATTSSMPSSKKSILAIVGRPEPLRFHTDATHEAWEYQMATNTMDNDVDPSTSGEDNDPASEITSLRERLMRALAETENTRRQGERRAQDAQRYAITNFARELLQVVDNLRRAVDADAADPEAKKTGGLIEGVAATDRILTQILNRFGVEEIKALNAPFDPRKHEAVMETDATEQPPGSVAQVLESGYMLHDRLLRPARVVVAKAGQQSSQAAER